MFLKNAIVPNLMNELGVTCIKGCVIVEKDRRSLFLAIVETYVTYNSKLEDGVLVEVPGHSFFNGSYYFPQNKLDFVKENVDQDVMDGLSTCFGIDLERATLREINTSVLYGTCYALMFYSSLGLDIPYTAKERAEFWYKHFHVAGSDDRDINHYLNAAELLRALPFICLLGED